MIEAENFRHGPKDAWKMLCSLVGDIRETSASLSELIVNNKVEAIATVVAPVLFIVELPQIGAVVVVFFVGRGVFRLQSRLTEQRVGDLQVLLDDAQADNIFLEAQLQIAQAENRSLSQENAVLRHENSTQRTDLARLEVARRNLEEELAESRRANLELREELDSTQARIASLETMVANMQWQLNEIQERRGPDQSNL